MATVSAEDLQCCVRERGKWGSDVTGASAWRNYSHFTLSCFPLRTMKVFYCVMAWSTTCNISTYKHTYSHMNEDPYSDANIWVRIIQMNTGTALSIGYNPRQSPSGAAGCLSSLTEYVWGIGKSSPDAGVISAGLLLWQMHFSRKRRSGRSAGDKLVCRRSWAELAGWLEACRLLFVKSIVSAAVLYCECFLCYVIMVHLKLTQIVPHQVHGLDKRGHLHIIVNNTICVVCICQKNNTFLRCVTPLRQNAKAKVFETFMPR